MKLIQEKAAHWYTASGEPMYEVKAKSRVGMKAVTLREARELKLYPSVTTILQVINKPALEAWKIEQGIMAALTLPRLENEPLDIFAHRVVQDMDSQVSDAADFGSQIHAGIEQMLLGNMADAVMPNVELHPYLEHVEQWIKANVVKVHAVEKIVVHPSGYAGKLDLHCELKDVGEAVVDFKTQGIKNRKAVFYDEWPLQLVAYAGALETLKGVRLVSVVVNSKQPEPVQTQMWTGDYWYIFLSAFNLWKYLKDYDPTA